VGEWQLKQAYDVHVYRCHHRGTGRRVAYQLIYVIHLFDS